MLSAAIRDLHLTYPDKYITEVRTSCPDIWLHNPNIEIFDANEKYVQYINCHYPLIHQSNQLPYHFIHGFIHYLNQELKLEIKLTDFKGDIYLSDKEKQEPLQVKSDKPIWLIVSGGKYDFTAKWWDVLRYQEVVNYFKGRIQFVQVGELAHYHPALNNVIDLRGKTTIRQLIKLMYHAGGVVTPVSLLMHLAAAVETKTNMPHVRPCVVIAGGREPIHWEHYPGHIFLHTIGKLDCCKSGGCWKSRVTALGDGSNNDKSENLCVDVVNNLPHCLDMITAEQVIESIETYLADF